MNNFQKAGTLFVRIVGGSMVLWCFILLLLDLVDMAIPRQATTPRLGTITFEVPIYKLINEAVTAGVGLALWLFAIPIGRLLGKRLD